VCETYVYVAVTHKYCGLELFICPSIVISTEKIGEIPGRSVDFLTGCVVMILRISAVVSVLITGGKLRNLKLN
jgi:hypothetical protein